MDELLKDNRTWKHKIKTGWFDFLFTVIVIYVSGMLTLKLHEPTYIYLGFISIALYVIANNSYAICVMFHNKFK